MAVSLRFLGRAATLPAAALRQQSLAVQTAASPALLGGRTPKTPRTPGSALAFFETPAASPPLGSPPLGSSQLAFFADGRSPAASPLAAASPAAPAPPAGGPLPVLLGRRPMQPRAFDATASDGGGANADARPEAATAGVPPETPEVAAARGAHRAFLARQQHIVSRRAAFAGA